MENDMILVAVHSENAASEIAGMFKGFGIECFISAIDGLSGEVKGRYKGVYVKPEQLADAVRILESGNSWLQIQTERTLDDVKNELLIPVDFSESTDLALKIGFGLAARLRLKVKFLNVYSLPYMSEMNSAMGSPDQSLEDITEMEESASFFKNSEKKMKSLMSKVDRAISEGLLPKINYSYIVTGGVPEEEILRYSRDNKPAMIVMATRGATRRKEELIGSVTAEVLDRCRVPVFTVPENIEYNGIEQIKRLVYFCNLDKQDVWSVDSLMKMFGYPEVSVTLIPVNGKVRNMREKTEDLRKYFETSYPNAEFSVKFFEIQDFRASLENFIKDEKVQILLVPNKKMNIFARIFRPGIAHKILFEKDIPMLALPV